MIQLRKLYFLNNNNSSFVWLDDIKTGNIFKVPSGTITLVLGQGPHYHIFKAYFVLVQNKIGLAREIDFKEINNIEID